MTRTLADGGGFAHPTPRELPPRRYLASLELMAGVALVVSTVVAATVVSIGIARADGLGPAPAPDGALALAVLFGMVLGGWGLLTVLMTRGTPYHE